MVPTLAVKINVAFAREKLPEQAGDLTIMSPFIAGGSFGGEVMH
jgi:hypothetical protein